MTSQTNISYYKANQAEIQALIIAENQKRYKEGFQPLTEADIDGLVTQLAAGTPKDQIKYPAAKKKPVQALEPTTSDKSFQIKEVSNGFLLQAPEGPYIFKTLRELTKIFRTILFKEHKLTQEKPKKEIKKLKAVNE